MRAPAGCNGKRRGRNPVGWLKGGSRERTMSASPDCVFCRIVSGNIPSYEIWRDEWTLAFLDIGPLAPGHLLVIPQAHYATMDEVPDEVAQALGVVLPRMTRAVLRATQAPGVNLLQNNGRCAGQEVEHVHIHLIPRTEGDGLGYRWHPQEYAAGKAEAMRDQLGRALKV